MKPVIQFSLILSVVLFSFLVSCTNVSEKRQLLYLEEGTHCYQTNQEQGVTHIKMSISEKVIEGVILLNLEYSENRYTNFSGNVINDSLFIIFIHSEQDDRREWILRTNKDGLEISGFNLYEEKLQLRPLDCNNFPDISLYTYINDGEEDGYEEEEESAEAEPLDNSDLICFYMYYPGGTKRTQIEEYIQLSNKDGKLSGLGAGISEGETDWSFGFEGRFINGDTAQITAVYKQENGNSFISNETWIINLQKNTLKLDHNKPIDIRILGDGEFHKISCSNIEEWAIELLKKY